MTVCVAESVRRGVVDFLIFLDITLRERAETEMLMAQIKLEIWEWKWWKPTQMPPETQTSKHYNNISPGENIKAGALAN